MAIAHTGFEPQTLKSPLLTSNFSTQLLHYIHQSKLRIVSNPTHHSRAEMKHKLNPVMDAQLNRNRRMNRHRRNLSDGGHIGEDVSYNY